ncbi:IS110 family transposase [Streptomyces hundungensis]|uniref:IS110 family transposase n=1 Tax=Streptomyces hundungensis TaxID=1077946 RepID=UPI001FE28CF7|nr:IS110 family transposase [Streptomyces hundungensis]
MADQARIRSDLHPLRTGSETVTDLKILTGRGIDLVADRTRTLRRLRAQLARLSPRLERALDVTDVGPLVLLTGYQTPAALPGSAALAEGLAAQPRGPPFRPAGRGSPFRPPRASTPGLPPPPTPTRLLQASGVGGGERGDGARFAPFRF